MSGFQFELPNGANLELQSVEEVELLTTSLDMLTADYTFDKFNDRVLLGGLLTQHLLVYRAQLTLTRPIGQQQGHVGVKEHTAANSQLLKSLEEIRKLEEALGINKKTRESTGNFSVQEYLTKLKRAANEYGIHVTERTLAYEAFVNALRVKVRILDNADAEDRAHENISEKSVLEYVRRELDNLEQVDKDYATQKQTLWKGSL